MDPLIRTTPRFNPKVFKGKGPVNRNFNRTSFLVYFLEFSKKTTNSGIIPENRTCCEQVEERAEIERHKVKNPHLNY